MAFNEALKARMRAIEAAQSPASVLLYGITLTHQLQTYNVIGRGVAWRGTAWTWPHEG